jgi:hypothetical protein
VTLPPEIQQQAIAVLKIVRGYSPPLRAQSSNKTGALTPACNVQTVWTNHHTAALPLPRSNQTQRHPTTPATQATESAQTLLSAPSLKPPLCNHSISSHRYKPAAARPRRAPTPAWRPLRHLQRAHPHCAAPQHPASRPLDTVPPADPLVLPLTPEVPAGASETRRHAVWRIVQVRELRPVTALHGLGSARCLPSLPTACRSLCDFGGEECLGGLLYVR